MMLKSNRVTFSSLFCAPLLIIELITISPAHAEDRPSSPPLSSAANTPAVATQAAADSNAFEINRPPSTSFEVNKPQSRCDAACIEANSDRAARACARRLEAEAPTDFEWVPRPFGNIFQEASPAAPDSSVVFYRGDAIRFLNPQKEWVRVSYQCAFDVDQGKANEVRVRPGRLNAPPSAQAQKSQPATRPGTGPAGPSLQPQGVVGQPQPGQAAAPGQPKIDSAALAAAIQQAAQKRQAARTPKIGEDSEIEFTQMPVNKHHF